MTNDVAVLLVRLEAVVRNRGPQVLTGLAILGAFWIAGRIVASIIRSAAARTDEDKHDVILLLGRAARAAIVIVGVIMALSNMGINVNALITGLGLSGFALGFALRDALSNVLAGVLIIMYRPFKRNDIVNITAIEGRVVSIDLRYTILEADQKTYMIPNTTIFNNTITVIRRAGP
jgi:small-conductance mechanosensitive channel